MDYLGESTQCLRYRCPVGIVDERYLYSAVSASVLACAYEVHNVLGPGLLESAYKACLARELRLKGLNYETETPIRVEYKGEKLEVGYRADLIVEDKVLVELKSIDRLLGIHDAQLLTYLRLSGVRVGLLINFNVNSLKNGIRRLVK